MIDKHFIIEHTYGLQDTVDTLKVYGIHRSEKYVIASTIEKVSLWNLRYYLCFGRISEKDVALLLKKYLLFGICILKP